MEIKTPKLTTIDFTKYKWSILSIVFCCLSFSAINGQSFEHISNGDYKFLSDYPDWDLHFWLYDDGHHSFTHEPIHHYDVNDVLAEPKLYHAKPYDPNEDDVFGISLGTIPFGGSNVSVAAYDFDNQVQIKRSWNLVNSNDNYFILMFENSQYPQAISGCVEFHFNDEDSEINTNNILDDYDNDWVEYHSLEESDFEEYTHKYVWHYDDLEPNEQRFVYIPAICLGAPMSNVFTRAVFKVNECDRDFDTRDYKDGALNGIDDSPYYTLRSRVVNHPHDPNYIESDPDCITTKEVMSHTVRYKLVFQNEGVDPSEDVTVLFNTNVLLGSVVLVNSSDDCLLEWNPHGIRVHYEDVYIRGLNEPIPPHYKETIEWVEVDVCYNLAGFGANNVHCFDFDADVIFDGQDPITAYSQICKEHHCPPNYDGLNAVGPCIPAPPVQGNAHLGHKLTAITNNDETLNFNIYPNPANDMIIIESGNLDENSMFSITNMLGETVVKNTKLKNGVNEIDISNLESGVYFVRNIVNNKIESKSFIKI